MRLSFEFLVLIARGFAALGRHEGRASRTPEGEFPTHMSPEIQFDFIHGRAVNFFASLLQKQGRGVSRTVKATKLCYRIVNKPLNTVLSDHSILCRKKCVFTTQTGYFTKTFCRLCKSNRKVTKMVQFGCDTVKIML
ncbi:MAG: hypothetical protein IJH52_07235 [Oscillospiraceae bacterium]|nr:hypothetical protein [Oscillospiraceae bacterium]MBQ6402931.1 hypothetical protein [Oscillospiraceae bacterium]